MGCTMCTCLIVGWTMTVDPTLRVSVHTLLRTTWKMTPAKTCWCSYHVETSEPRVQLELLCISGGHTHAYLRLSGWLP